MAFCAADQPAAFTCRPGVSLSPCGPASILPRVFGKSNHERRLRQLVDCHVSLVARILRNAGTAEADVEDDVQQVFIALSNRLDDVRSGTEKSFLIQTALNVAAHARRTAARRREILTDCPPESADSFPGPEQAAHRRQMRQTLDHVLDQMDIDLRAVFTLYEFEELTMGEIASALDIPHGTVASRLRRARADFRERVSGMHCFSKAEVV